MNRQRTADAGFTLVEVLVAVVMTGLLMAGLAQSVRYGLAVWRAQAGAVARYDDLEATDRVLRQLFGHIESVRPIDSAALQGEPHQFRFITQVPGIAALGTSRATISLFVNTRHELVLRWRPRPNDAAGDEGARSTDTVLLSGVGSVDFQYWGAEAPSDDVNDWHSDWRRPTPPELVKVHLEFLPDSRRQWPDIVAARILG